MRDDQVREGQLVLWLSRLDDMKVRAFRENDVAVGVEAEAWTTAFLQACIPQVGFRFICDFGKKGWSFRAAWLLWVLVNLVKELLSLLDPLHELFGLLLSLVCTFLRGFSCKADS